MESRDTDDDIDLQYEIARSNYGGMLHDVERNKAYNDAIYLAVQKMLSDGKDVFVLDIGTGSGLLAMMAASAGAHRVVACESFQPVAKAAEKVIKTNGLDNVVEVVNKSSFDLNIGEDTQLHQKPTLLISEILDTELLGEGVLPTLRHAHEHLLDVDCLSVPWSAEAFVQPISSEFLWKCHKLKPNHIKLELIERIDCCLGTASPYEVHVERVEDIRCHSNPVSVVSLDFQTPYYHTVKDARSGNHSYTVKEITVNKGDEIHALLFWWKLQLDEQGKITLEVKPEFHEKTGEIVNWRDHWMQAVYFLPKPLQVTKGDELSIVTYYDDYSFWFDVRPTSKMKSASIPVVVERPLCSCGLHIRCSRERFQMHNSEKLRKSYETLFSKYTKDLSRCLCIGEMSLLPFTLLQSGAHQVIYVECSQTAGNFVAELAAQNNCSQDITIIKKNGAPSREELELLFNKYKVDIIVADPFFSSHLLPWHHLHLLFTFWDAIASAANVQSRLTIPDRAVLKGIAVELNHLWKTKAAVKEVEGFDLTDFDDLIQSSFSPRENSKYGLLSEGEPYPMWEYEHRIISHDFQIMEFHTGMPVHEETFNEGVFTYTSDGTCHAVVLWMEFWFDDILLCTTGFEILDDGNSKWVPYSKQALVFLRGTNQVKKDSKGQFSCYFNRVSEEILFRFTTALSARHKGR